MKTSLDHLLEQKIHKLKRAMVTICEFVDAPISPLFGSHARDDWVGDLNPGTLQFGYQSGLDWLVMIKARQQACQVKQHDRLSRRLSAHAQRTPVSVKASCSMTRNKCQRFYGISGGH